MNEIQKAHILTEEALPYIQKFKNKIVVIKYGGNAMTSSKLKTSVMKDIVLLKNVGILPVVIHGGGPFITEEMEKAKIKPKFVKGLRVTDEPTIRIIKKVFKKVNNEIKSNIKKAGGKAETVQSSISVKQKNKKLGLVGEITKINKTEIKKSLKKGKIPVISPLGTGKDKKTYNINADTAATKIAIALKAEKMTLLTNVHGVIEKRNFIPHLSIKDAHKHIKNKVITKGMIPKVQACVEAVEAGCKKAHLINGTIDHALLLEIFTDKGIGTEIVK